MKHFPTKELGYATAFIVLLAALYAGSYYAMVRKVVLIRSWPVIDSFARNQVVILSDETSISAEYHFGGHAAKSFFSFWHDVDRRIRPEFWTR
jgi:hypothetical protein